jgi:hypothetical protein
MKTSAARFAAGVALIALGGPLPAYGQFVPPLIIVPPPAQQYYGAPSPVPEPTRPARPKPQADTPPPTPTRRGHYEGRTYVPD